MLPWRIGHKTEKRTKDALLTKKKSPSYFDGSKKGHLTVFCLSKKKEKFFCFASVPFLSFCEWVMTSEFSYSLGFHFLDINSSWHFFHTHRMMDAERRYWHTRNTPLLKFWTSRMTCKQCKKRQEPHIFTLLIFSIHNR